MNARTAVIVKGNPKYVENNPHAAAFYRDLESHLSGLGYKVTTDPGEPHTTPPPADLWVGHSRGAGRLRFAPEGTRTVALGTASGLHHPEDNSLHDFNAVPNEHHYALTPQMLSALAEGAPNMYGQGKTAALITLGLTAPPRAKTAAYAGIRPQHINTILQTNQRLGTVADTTAALRKTREELDEFEAELAREQHEKATSELGDTLLAVHLLAGRYGQQYGRDPHAAAHDSTLKVVNRMKMIEAATKRGTPLPDAIAAAKKAYP